MEWMQCQRLFPNDKPSVRIKSLPVLFWGKEQRDVNKPIAEIIDNHVIIFHVDLIATIIFMLTRWEEVIQDVRGVHNRFPASASLAYKQNFLDRPIVDEYALVFQTWVKKILPSWQPQKTQASLWLTHDIDHLNEYASLYSFGKQVLKSIFRLQGLKHLRYIIEEFIKVNRDLTQGRYYQSALTLSNLDKKHNYKSTFFFQASKRTHFDSGYDPSRSEIQGLFKEISSSNHEIGLHIGYYSYDNEERIRKEFTRLRPLIKQTSIGVRSHYLRFRVPHSWRFFSNTGLAYDCTMGYAEYEGFRCGTCHPFNPFDLERNKKIDITEIPLIVMDGTLKNYRHMNIQEAEERILTLAKRCKNVGGVFTLLWHNTNIDGEWIAWGELYKRILTKLKKLFYP
jgi:peptidoglycan/xylan/chitin deacetylase (PgdA/CDA1 family)